MEKKTLVQRRDCLYNETMSSRPLPVVHLTRPTMKKITQNLTNLLLDVPKLLKMTLSDISKRICNRLSNQSFKLKHQKKNHLGINSRPDSLTFFAISSIWGITSSVNNVRIILPPLEPPNQTKSRLRSHFFKIESSFGSNNTKEI